MRGPGKISGVFGELQRLVVLVLIAELAHPEMGNVEANDIVAPREGLDKMGPHVAYAQNGDYRLIVWLYRGRKEAELAVSVAHRGWRRAGVEICRQVTPRKLLPVKGIEDLGLELLNLGLDLRSQNLSHVDD